MNHLAFWRTRLSQLRKLFCSFLAICVLCGSTGAAPKPNVIGKWHLGNRDVFQPLNHGFNAWYGNFLEDRVKLKTPVRVDRLLALKGNKTSRGSSGHEKRTQCLPTDSEVPNDGGLKTPSQDEETDKSAEFLTDTNDTVSVSNPTPFPFLNTTEAVSEYRGPESERFANR